jgi:hypothetical protein
LLNGTPGDGVDQRRVALVRDVGEVVHKRVVARHIPVDRHYVLGHTHDILDIWVVVTYGIIIKMPMYGRIKLFYFHIIDLNNVSKDSACLPKFPS